jgi:hypothetical protein
VVLIVRLGEVVPVVGRLAFSYHGAGQLPAFQLKVRS